MTNLIDYIAESIGGGVGQNDKKVDKETEAKLAVTIANACCEKNFRYGNGYIMAFDGKAYRLMTDKEIETMLVSALENKGTGVVYTVNSISVIRKHLERRISREYQPKKHLIAFNNVVFDMDLNETYPHAENLETNICMPYDYDPKAECPMFLRFLSEVLPSAGLRETVQEFCGALFVDRRLYKIENILFLIGTGQNGKGVFSEAIQNMLGAGNYTSFSVERLVKSSDKAGNIAAMNGKLANICPDMSKGDISGGDFKIIVSGENIQARFQYGRSFQATELPLIIANVNEMPVTTDHSYGHHRRPLPIPFNVTISNETKDVELPTKLRGEVSGIFNWVYEGRKRFIKNDGKFSEGPEVLAEKERIRVESNSVLQFLAANEYSAKRSEGAVEIYLTNKELYKAYQDHCNDYGKKNVFEMINMGKIMNQEGYEAVRKTRGRGYLLFMGGKKFEEVITEEEGGQGVDSVFVRKPGDSLNLPF